MSSPPGSLLSFITTVGWAMKKGGRFGSRTGSYFLFPWIRTVVLLDQVAQKFLKIRTALYSIICLIRHKTRQKSNKLNRYVPTVFFNKFTFLIKYNQQIQNKKQKIVKKTI